MCRTVCTTPTPVPRKRRQILGKVTLSAYECLFTENVICFHSLSLGLLFLSHSATLLLSLFFKKGLCLLFFNYVYACMFMCGYVHMSANTYGGQKGHEIPQS